ncbi:MAG TPA: hypothetical protein VII82_14395 [Polyangiaceae bacterium]|jgi:hypothetical protein
MRRLSSALLVVLFGVGGAAAACSSEPSSTPAHNPGDTLIVDVEASAAPPEQSTDADLDPDGIFARVDGSAIYGQGNYDGSYPVLTICAPPDGSAGASPSDGGKKSSGDAGVKGEADAAATADAAHAVNGGDGGYAAGDAGCVAFPASCMSQPDCTCLLGAFVSQISCAYPSCEVKLDGSGFSVYCPP